jgi:hypothetical protein
MAHDHMMWQSTMDQDIPYDPFSYGDHTHVELPASQSVALCFDQQLSIVYTMGEHC